MSPGDWAQRLTAVVPALLLAILAYGRRWTCDDAFIDFRVVQNWLAGHGPVFNVGERVEAFTNPAWVGLLALWRWLGGPLEWGSVVMGLAFTVAGLVAAVAGATRLARRAAGRPGGSGSKAPARTILLPLGALVIASLPPQWDFSTSGLETGLTFLWLGATFWGLARALPSPASPDEAREGHVVRWRALAVLGGLGPLIRPDLAVFSATFLAAVVVCQGEARRRPLVSPGSLALVGWALALPLAYELFRMGYYAALVPNSATGKEAGLAHWSRGWAYARDFIGPYALWVPLALLLIVLLAALGRAWRGHDRGAVAVLLAPAGGAVLHALFVVRVGGDFMHARLLLPALWGVLLPVAVVPMPIGRPARLAGWTAWGAAGALVVWAATCAVALRVHYDARGIGPNGIADERAYYVHESGHAHPVTGRDYASMMFAADGEGLRQITTGAIELPLELPDPAMREDVRGVVLIDISDSPSRQRPADGRARAYPLRRGADPAVPLVVGRWNIGLTGFIAGSAVHVVDRHGIADPIAARLRMVEAGRPGHTKVLLNDWIVARFSAVDPSDSSRASVAAARRALACRPLAGLLEAVEAPLTLGRFVRNVRRAPALHALRIAPSPVDAERELCGGAGE